jgi:phospholipid transport system transporter-binding protein
MKLEATALTNDTAAALLETGRAAIRSGDLSFDLASVRQVDSAAVALLLAWQREAAASQGRITLSNVPPALVSLASLYGVDGLLGCAHQAALRDTETHGAAAHHGTS